MEERKGPLEGKIKDLIAKIPEGGSIKNLGKKLSYIDFPILNSTTEEDLKFPSISNNELILQFPFRLIHIVTFLSFKWI